MKGRAKNKSAPPAAADRSDWKVFQGKGDPHTRLAGLPLPPWRKSEPITEPEEFPPNLLERDAKKANPFLPDLPMIWAVNAALYLRRPLLLTGKPGTGKSTLIVKVAQELKLGPVLRWDITSRSTVRSGIYEYDAIGRLQRSHPGADEPPVEDYLTLGPLGTAMLGTTWPRALLIDEIDKGDLDLANDLLNVIEEGVYDIPELRRLGQARGPVQILDGFKHAVSIHQGHLECRQFPFVVMTSNAEREFPPPFLRRCIRLTIKPADTTARLTEIVNSHMGTSLAGRHTEVQSLIDTFFNEMKNNDLATDQLLNAVFLILGRTDGSEKTFAPDELNTLRAMLFEKLA
ncbi:MAG: AAA family ATPase [Verrucomicrobiia bacterium]